MKPFSVLVVLAAACVAAPSALIKAQAAKPDSALKLSASVRLRYETISGQPRAGFNDTSDFFNVRSQLAADYKAGGWRVGAEVYDSRVYGAEAGDPLSTNEVNALEIVQAYVARRFQVSPDVTSELMAGRMTLNLGSRRLVAADDYRNTTNGYTGLRFDIGKKDGPSATAIYVLPQTRLPFDAQGLNDNTVEVDRESFDLRLYGGVATLPIGAKGAALQPTFFRLEESDQPDIATRDRRLNTIGLRYFRDPAAGKIDFDVEAMKQTGSVRASLAPTAADQDVDASYLHAELGKSWTGAWKPRLAFEFDHVSGDKPGGKNERFDTLFGMRRSELGPAGLYNSVGRANMSATGLRLEVTPNARLDAFAGIKGLWLASDTDAFSTTGVRDATGGSGDHAGTQVEARVRYWLVPRKLRADANLVLLDKGNFLRRAPNTPNGDDTAYMALDLTAIF